VRSTSAWAPRGLFPTRVELIEGAIYDMSAQKSEHAVVVSLAEAALRSAFGAGFYVRVQMPLALGDDLRAGDRDDHLPVSI